MIDFDSMPGPTDDDRLVQAMAAAAGLMDRGALGALATAVGPPPPRPLRSFVVKSPRQPLGGSGCTDAYRHDRDPLHECRPGRYDGGSDEDRFLRRVRHATELAALPRGSVQRAASLRILCAKMPGRTPQERFAEAARRARAFPGGQPAIVLEATTYTTPLWSGMRIVGPRG